MIRTRFYSRKTQGFPSLTTVRTTPFTRVTYTQGVFGTSITTKRGDTSETISFRHKDPFRVLKPWRPNGQPRKKF